MTRDITQEDYEVIFGYEGKIDGIVSYIKVDQFSVEHFDKALINYIKNAKAMIMEVQYSNAKLLSIIQKIMIEIRDLVNDEAETISTAIENSDLASDEIRLKLILSGLE